MWDSLRDILTNPKKGRHIVSHSARFGVSLVVIGVALSVVTLPNRIDAGEQLLGRFVGTVLVAGLLTYLFVFGFVIQGVIFGWYPDSHTWKSIATGLLLPISVAGYSLMSPTALDIVLFTLIGTAAAPIFIVWVRSPLSKPAPRPGHPPTRQ